MLKLAATSGETQLPWVPVLQYHQVVPRLPDRDPYANCITTSVFEDHLRWLAWRGYRALTVSELTQPGAHGRGYGGLRVAITFDDGYEDNCTYALPLLMRYGFNATVFVVTDTVGAYNDFDADVGVDRTRMLTASQIQTLASCGIEIGSHTCSHPPSLPALSDGGLHAELRNSRQILEDIVGGPVHSFSYPHSRVSSRAEAAVASAGYRAACAGVGTRFTLYRLSRVATSASRGLTLEAAFGWRWMKHAVGQYPLSRT